MTNNPELHEEAVARLNRDMDSMPGWRARVLWHLAHGGMVLASPVALVFAAGMPVGGVVVAATDTMQSEYPERGGGGTP